MGLDLNFLISTNGIGAKPNAGSAVLNSKSTLSSTGAPLENAQTGLDAQSGLEEVSSFAQLLAAQQTTTGNAHTPKLAATITASALNTSTQNNALLIGQDGQKAGTNLATSAVQPQIPQILQESSSLTPFNAQTLLATAPLPVTSSAPAASLPIDGIQGLESTLLVQNNGASAVAPGVAVQNPSTLNANAAQTLVPELALKSSEANTATLPNNAQIQSNNTALLAAQSGPGRNSTTQNLLATVASAHTPIAPVEALAGTAPVSNAAATNAGGVNTPPVAASTAVASAVTTNASASNTPPVAATLASIAQTLVGTQGASTLAPGRNAGAQAGGRAPQSIGNLVNAAFKGGNAAAVASPGNSANVANGSAPANTGTAAALTPAQIAAQIAVMTQTAAAQQNIGQNTEPNATSALVANRADDGQGARISNAGAEQIHIERATENPVQNTQRSTAAAQHTPRMNQANLNQFAANLAQRVQGGSTKFEMRLDPPELGKVQVRLEVSADNRVEAVISSHRPEVLADLQRGADSLRRALIDAGFDAGADGLSFSLEQGSEGAEHADGDNNQPWASDSNVANEQEDQNTVPLAQAELGYGMTRVFAGGIDVRA